MIGMCPCGQAVQWARDTHGNDVAVNASPDPDGDIVLAPRGLGFLTATRIGPDADRTHLRVYREHRETCAGRTRRSAS